MIKVLLCVALVGAVMTAVGWLSFSNNDSEATLTIDKQQVIEDTTKVKEKVEEFVEELQQPEAPQAMDDGLMPADTPQDESELKPAELPTEIQPADGALIVPEADTNED